MKGWPWGKTVPIARLAEASGDVVALVDGDCPYYRAAELLNNAPAACQGW